MLDILAVSADEAWWSTIDWWALALVGIGVTCEGVGHFAPKRLLESKTFRGIAGAGWAMVVLGLLGEVVAASHRDADSGQIKQR